MKKGLFYCLSFLWVFSISVTASISVAKQQKPKKMTVQEGLNKLKKNYNNASSNLKGYKTNLNIVNQNLGEIDEILKLITQQEGQVGNALKEHQQGLQSLTQDRDISNQFIAKEQKLLAQEKIYQLKLEKVMKLLKKREKVRTANIQFYEQQMKDMLESEKTIKGNIAKIDNSLKVFDSRKKNIGKAKESWLKKRKGYEKEVGRWLAETRKHEKLYNNYKNLKENSL